MVDTLDVFKDLYIRGPNSERQELRNALLAAACDPWSVDLKRSRKTARDPAADGTVLFLTAARESYPEAELTLWENDEGYYVLNIVPLGSGRLSRGQYNAILDDFFERVASKVVTNFSFEISTSAAQQSIEDWVSEDAATKLRRFSRAASKKTGISHPADQKRWFQFILAVHRSGQRLDTIHLARWLNEVDGWEEETARRLASKFEGSIALLNFHDQN